MALILEEFAQRLEAEGDRFSISEIFRFRDTLLTIFQAMDERVAYLTEGLGRDEILEFGNGRLLLSWSVLGLLPTAVEFPPLVETLNSEFRLGVDSDQSTFVELPSAGPPRPYTPDFSSIGPSWRSWGPPVPYPADSQLQESSQMPTTSTPIERHDPFPTEGVYYPARGAHAPNTREIPPDPPEKVTENSKIAGHPFPGPEIFIRAPPGDLPYARFSKITLSHSLDELIASGSPILRNMFPSAVLLRDVGVGEWYQFLDVSADVLTLTIKPLNP